MADRLDELLMMRVSHTSLPGPISPETTTMSKKSSKRGNRRNRETFSAIKEATRKVAAQAAWDRAMHASALRHSAIDPKSKRRLSEIKIAAIERAATLTPELVKIGIDDEVQLGLPSVRFARVGKLHLPWRHVLVLGSKRNSEILHGVT